MRLSKEARDAWAQGLLVTAPTRQLLSYLDKARKCGGSYSPVDSKSEFQLSVEELKAELAKREHVPRGKDARRAKQKAKQNR